jgi:DUF1680 family protein
MEVNRRASLPHGLAEFERGGNLHNLRVAAGQASGHRPTLTLDADVHKWLEAAAWELGREEEAALRGQFDTVVELLLSAQRSDGYLNSWFQVVEPGRVLADQTRGCEMYCAGHFIEAGVAAAQALSDDRLLRAARRFADLLDDRFGPNGVLRIDGHEEIELALVSLYRATGEHRYLRLASRFIDARGRGLVGPGVFGPRYYQDHEPVREATTVTGHAVRAMYLATGAADIYLETGDTSLLAALETQWESMVADKMYLTGGLGSRERDEAIGEPYELSPDRAYCETCAAAGLVFWNWRMLRATGAARYADLMERALYNAFLAGVALDGRSFFYANPLEVRAEHEPPFEAEWTGETPWYISPAPEQSTAQRRAWFRCACCPPNVMRLLASLDQYIATVDDEGLQVQMYAASDLDLPMAGGRVVCSIATDYPWRGTVDITVRETPAAPWTLALRIPAWAEATVLLPGGSTESAGPGYWRGRRVWKAGDTVQLTLPLTPRFVTPSPRASAIRGCLAIERGPLVYCVEQADNPGINLADATIDPRQPLSERPHQGLLDGLTAVEVQGFLAGAPPAAGVWPYRDWTAVAPDDRRPVALTAVPYFAWANRKAGAMRVWLSATDPTPPQPPL